MRYSFIRSAQLCEICAKEGLSVSEVMLRREMERSERSRDDIMADLRSNLQVMQTSITKGLDPENLQHGVFTLQQAAIWAGKWLKLWQQPSLWLK